MSRSTVQRSSRTRGFTLVESLVALAIMMIALSAIGALNATSHRADQHVERHLADIENAQQILAGLPSRRDLANLPLSGETAGYRWRLGAAQFNGAFANSRERTGWTPETIVLTLQGPGRAPLSFDMVRLVRIVAK